MRSATKVATQYLVAEVLTVVQRLSPQENRPTVVEADLDRLALLGHQSTAVQAELVRRAMLLVAVAAATRPAREAKSGYGFCLRGMGGMGSGTFMNTLKILTGTKTNLVSPFFSRKSV